MSFFEPLEQRRLLTAELDQNGILTIIGSDAADEIRLDIRSGLLNVHENAGDSSFDASSVRAIFIDARDGDDLVLLGPEILGSFIFGGPGSDTLIGGNANDTLSGGGGNDHLDGKLGADLFFGGSGFDSADYRFRSEDLILSIDGNDNDGALNRVPDDDDDGDDDDDDDDDGDDDDDDDFRSEGDNIASDVERIIGGSGNDRITGNDDHNSISGWSGNDTLVGRGGNDSLDGDHADVPTSQHGDDQLLGNDGDDRLTGHFGQDALSGGDGNDSFLAEDGAVDDLDGGDDDDTAITLDPRDQTIRIENLPAAPEPEITVLRDDNLLNDDKSVVGFGQIELGQPGPLREFTVRNDGDAMLALGNVLLPEGFILAEPLADRLAPGESDTFSVRLQSDSPGLKEGQLRFNTNDLDEDPFNFTITGLVEEPPPPRFPQIVVSRGGDRLTDGQSSIDFGLATRGESGPLIAFTVTNNGKSNLQLGNVSLPAGFSLVNDLVSQLAPGESDNFSIRLDTNDTGLFSGQVRINNNDPDEDPFDFQITGRVQNSEPLLPEIVVALDGKALIDGQSSVNFGAAIQNRVGPLRVFTVRNTGKGDLTLGPLLLPDGFAVIDDLAPSLAPGQSDTFSIRLLTQSPGKRIGQLRFTSNDADENPFNFTLRGQVSAPRAPEIILSRGSKPIADNTGLADFGAIPRGGKGKNITFTLRNTGSARLALGRMQLPAGFTLVEGLKKQLSPNASDTFTIHVDARAPGVRSGQLSLATNDADENPFNFNLAGRVVAPEIAVSLGGVNIADGAAAPVDFGVAEANQQPTRTFVVRNVGDAPLRAGKIKLPSGFTLLEGLPKVIKPGASHNLTLRLSANPGIHSGQVSILNSDSDENPFNFPLRGEVRAKPPVNTAGQPLRVTGTPGNDIITLSGSGKSVTVVINGKTTGPFNNVNRIILDALEGDDIISLANLSIPSTLLGGDGFDSITGGRGADSIRGGPGDDTLKGGAGADRLFGDADNDVINAVDGIPDALVDGGAGRDLIRSDPTDSRSGS